MSDSEFQASATHVMQWIASYLTDVGQWPILPSTSVGDVVTLLPSEAPADGESMDRILADFERMVVPHTTHWNHPGFFGYFSTSGSAAGILAEALIATLNVNAMLWRSGPAQTELEQVTLGWLRGMLGLPDAFAGHINDGASTSTLIALAAAREAQTDLRVREFGLAGRSDVPALRVYCSEEAHTSIDKAAVTLGLGLSGVSRIPTDDVLSMDVDALRSAIVADRARGIRPCAVVATVGTTSTTAVDPVAEIADVCESERIWLHVDAAYGGAAAVIPELRSLHTGWERAESIVVNPHKWLFVPMDCSVLWTRHPHMLRRAFSVVPEYLTTHASNDAHNLMDTGVALGRRFRALKLWFVFRHFGRNGIRERISEHIRLARLFAEWVDADPDFERMAPVPFATVVFRYTPAGADPDELDFANEVLLRHLNGTGEVFLSHTRVRGHHALRLAIGNLRTTEAHVARAWHLVRTLAEPKPHNALMGVALVVGLAFMGFGMHTLRSVTGTLDGVPAPPMFMNGTVALLAVAGDARIVRSGALRGGRRLARHLWRMCYALFIASGSFFLGQADEIPRAVRYMPALTIIALFPLIALVYWLVRTWGRRDPAPACGGAGESGLNRVQLSGSGHSIPATDVRKFPTRSGSL